MSQLRFDDRVAIVTGGGRGLGRSYARLLASRGAKVVVNDPGVNRDGTGFDVGPAQEVVGEIEHAGGVAIASTDSVATPQGAKAIVDSAIDRFGRVDILIHSAGNVRWAPLAEMTLQDFDAVLDVHLRGAFLMAQGVFPHMVKAGYGRIVLTSSIAGVYGDYRLANYGAAKAGTIGLCNVIALEGAEKGVKCNIILPGAVTRMADGLDTSTYPPTMGPDMVAPTVGWLAHESCSVSGEMLISMGGRVARAFIAETAGVARDDWSIERIAEQMPVIRSTGASQVFAPVPAGHEEHIRYSFAMRDMAANARTRSAQ
jgi:NAD(P)-dependent dehydrogenase (short-subunit alcohol dehydrogenase family)